jgi:hypothetical protein
MVLRQMSEENKRRSIIVHQTRRMQHVDDETKSVGRDVEPEVER